MPNTHRVSVSSLMAGGLGMSMCIISVCVLTKYCCVRTLIWSFQDDACVTAVYVKPLISAKTGPLKVPR